MARLYVGGYFIRELHDNWVAPQYKLSNMYDARKHLLDACLITSAPLSTAYIPVLVWGLGDLRDMNKSLEVTWQRVPINDDRIPNYVKLAEMLIN